MVKPVKKQYGQYEQCESERFPSKEGNSLTELAKLIYKKALSVIFLLSIFSFTCLGQSEYTQETKYNLETKHQLGISSAKFFALFNESVDNLGLSYRYHTDSGLNYRAGLSYELNTADDGSFEGGLKLGVDKYFRNYNQWRFYYGVELSLIHI